MIDSCVMCGEYVAEGSQVCVQCQYKIMKKCDRCIYEDTDVCLKCKYWRFGFYDTDRDKR